MRAQRVRKDPGPFPRVLWNSATKGGQGAPRPSQADKARRHTNHQEWGRLAIDHQKYRIWYLSHSGTMSQGVDIFVADVREGTVNYLGTCLEISGR